MHTCFDKIKDGKKYLKKKNRSSEKSGPSWVLEIYLKSFWALRVYSGMKDNILHIYQGANNIKEKLRPVFTLKVQLR
jgi:hypothetical protein